MITLLLGVVVGVVCGGLFAVFVPGHPVWAGVIGAVGFFGTSLAINLSMKKRLEALFLEVQARVQETQAQLRRRVNRMQTKNASGGKGFQRLLEKEQAEGIREAIAILDKVEPMKRWNLLAERQANTLRAQLYYQIKEFEKADEYLDKCLLMEPLLVGMKMVREYERGEAEKMEKTFRRGVKRFKDEKSTILYAAYSWILVKEKKIDEAVDVLVEAKDATEDETLRQNWEHLANGRVKRFSNAALGEQWYALHLEEPKPVRVKQRAGRRARRV